ncbi:MAG: hypothetical protein HY368_00900, partial [Candidatus Aenigmarchaeota archaeon]|nr:hypothetical protein [Candidatus Aenigmarchaeota archaeon]
MRHSNFSVMLVLCFVLLASLAAADYVDAGATVYAVNGTTVSVKGLIKHDNTSAINYTNVTANINSLNATTVSPLNNSAWATGFYEFNITAPITPGRYNVSLSVNLSNGTTVTKNIEIRAGPFSNATFNFTNKRPPFANGSYFELNISFAGLSPNAPSLQIFKSNAGNSTGWVMNNITSRINTNSIFYNITVPTDADGKYMIIFDEGSAGNTFLVKSGLITTVQAQDNESSTTTTFGQGETGRIEAKVRDENNPITNANVLAFVTFPNGTVVNVSLVHYSGSNGTYNMTFTYPNISGTYKIDIVTNTSGKILRTSTTSTVQGVEARLDTVKDFFFDFGSQSGFRKGGNVEFNIIVSNLSTDALLNGSLSGGAPDVYCNATRVTEMKNVLSGAVQSSPSLTKTTNLFVGQTVCKIRFTAPDADGIYSITVNASIGSIQSSNLSVSAAGYFSVQSFILMPSP